MPIYDYEKGILGFLNAVISWSVFPIYLVLLIVSALVIY